MQPVQLISAPSILGLKPTGVEKLGQSLLSHGLYQKLNVQHPIVNVPVLNSKYSFLRDVATNCLNASAIREFAIELGHHLTISMDRNYFPLILGGDCSILIGVMSALKLRGTYGLIFCDAHADFYEPERSITGEVADMDLAIVTGRDPELLSNIHDLRQYTRDEHVIHIGQRDHEETKKYRSQDIRKTSIRCFDFNTIQKHGIESILEKVVHAIAHTEVENFWLHFDTDVLSDEENPAVDYRLPGGVSVQQFEKLLKGLLSTNRIIGMTVTIFNPHLDDKHGSVSKMLTGLISRSFNRY